MPPDVAATLTPSEGPDQGGASSEAEPSLELAATLTCTPAAIRIQAAPKLVSESDHDTDDRSETDNKQSARAAKRKRLSFGTDPQEEEDGADQAAVREEAAGGPAPSHLRIEQSKEANANQESQSELSKLQAQVGYC